ncbi:protein-glutamate methylesterase/protein-glutamine glutaminase [Paenibacillus sp. y28]|uniref:protein-glutamate methylesterase/protein-glutamine glutaminase n=1 Tax=Paenibacillus sp. y28 TaxID=3129110 RepID=UPI00301690E5
MTRSKVLVVDDSVFMRKIISDLISEAPEFEVIATAKNGKEAVEKVASLKPDIVTMDVEMPEMNGLDALKLIMQQNPTPVIMLSSLTEAGAKETILALEWGAVDFVRKPSGSVSLDLYKVKIQLLEKLRTASKTRIKYVPASPPPAPVLPPKETKPAAAIAFPLRDKPKVKMTSPIFDQIVAIGTSTGGPKALQQVLTRLPASFPAPVVIVQHMPPGFTKSLAERLDMLSEIRVVEAEDDMILYASTAYIAPGGYHMKIVSHGPSQYRIRLNKEDPRGGHRPSVDILFESLIPVAGLKRHAVLMTGMGSDGARGMLGLRQAGAVSTLAEAEETCVVYGMPRSAVELGGAMYVEPLHQIPAKLVQLLT